ncbi:helix-turn-helix domain-containing protein [Streptomyces sp. NA02950]|uniref:helix-turn-helix domain-containing protein n=1 Tax=Streptomyces sp. NA02950 TaxID=2742137 RepID=UPI0015905DE2|nr:helix-turn-helix domain-containing protein [Streptomyces sp. NA02950]QKV92878.1 helix-turn-helix domain-containing protein [Streptomyces sp. NA02950]
MAVSPSATRADRADDVLVLARLSAKRGAVRAILDWLTRRTGGLAVLAGSDGSVLAAPGGTPDPAASPSAASAATAAVELHRRGAPSAVLGGDGAHPVHLVALGPGPGADTDGAAGDAAGVVYLAVVRPDDPRCGVLLADASRTLALCWRLEEAERARRRVESAEVHSREAVLHLLMVGSVPAAQRIAGALRPALPAVAQVYVIECPSSRRHEIAVRIDRTARGRAWIVPCPVRPHHLIALVPSEEDPGPRDRDPGPDRLDRLIARDVPECRVGVSAEVALRDTPAGYEQAFHALAVARDAPERCASFGGHTDVTVLAGPEGRTWADELLGPCLRYAPTRRADPGPRELLDTLGSWLSFGGAASRHLKIHRNTLAARVRHLDGLLGLDVSRRLASQSAAWLALRLHTAPWTAGAVDAATVDRAATLDALLATPAAEIWARTQLRPLEQARVTAGQETVRAWLQADARLPATASALGISLPGARKRLAKAEDALGRSLLRAPSAKYELWLAMRALGTL